jgi:UDP-D-galactose:(glucosyl)LPS alpha-1,6-D-galactosyltransferase
MENDSKKILICYFFFREGGIEKVIINIANSLSNDFQIKVVTFRNDNKEIKNIKKFEFINFNIPIIEFKINFLSKLFNKLNLLNRLNLLNFHLRGTKILKKFLEDYRPDVILCASRWDLFWILWVLRKNELLNKTKIGMWWHVSIKASTKLYFWCFRKLYLPKASFHIVLNESMKKEIQKLCPKKDVFVLYNPIDYSDTFFVSRGQNFLYVGRLDNKQKRLDRLFYALSQLKKYNWRLVIVGDGGDKPFLQNLAKNLKIEQRMDWLGWVENPWKVVNNINFGVLTSDFEGFGLVIAEGIYHGIPYISMNCPVGPKEIIQEGINGVLVPLDKNEEKNIQNLTETLKKALENKIELGTQEEMRTSVQKFALSEVQKNWKIFLNEILEHN